MTIMKRKMFLLTLLMSTSMLSIFSQEPPTKFFISGYKVHLIPSKTYSLTVKDSVKATQEMVDGVLNISIYDQTGQGPKDELYLCIDQLDYLYLHNSVLVSNETIKCDSLTLYTAAATGSLMIDSEYLAINLGGGSNFIFKGKTNFFDCAVGAGSSLSAGDLVAESADIDVMGYSSLVVNTKKANKKRVENSSFKNVAE